MAVDIESENSTAIALSGKRTRFIATVSGDIDPETEGYIIPQGVVWEISDFGDSGSLAMGTFIDPEGVLHVDRDEQNSFVQIKATSTVNSDEFGTLDVGINEEYTPDDSGDDSGDDTDPTITYPILGDAKIDMLVKITEDNIITEPSSIIDGSREVYVWDLPLASKSDEFAFLLVGEFSNIVFETNSGLSFGDGTPDDFTSPIFIVSTQTLQNTTEDVSTGITRYCNFSADAIDSRYGKNYQIRITNLTDGADSPT